MKNIKLLSALALMVSVAFTGCKKDDGPIRSSIIVDAVPTITTNIDASGSQSIDLLNLAAFSGKFTVSNYFAGTPGPTKVDIVVRKNGSNTNVKTYKSDITTLPASFSVTAAEIAALFGAPIALGDTYDFAPNITVNGKTYEAFLTLPGAVATGPGVKAGPGFSEFASYGAICAYDPNIYQGDFMVVSDAWADFSPGDVIKLTKVSNNSFSFTDPYAVNATPVPIVVTVNTANNQASIPKTVIGTKWVWAGVGGNPNYTGAFVQTTGAATASSVAPCSQTITLNMLYGVDQGTYSPYPLVLKKK